MKIKILVLSLVFILVVTRCNPYEAWMRPDVLDFDSLEGSGYVYWMGKGAPGNHEYVARMYGRYCGV